MAIMHVCKNNNNINNNNNNVRFREQFSSAIQLSIKHKASLNECNTQ